MSASIQLEPNTRSAGCSSRPRGGGWSGRAGIEPLSPARKAVALPLSYTRAATRDPDHPNPK